MPGFVRDNLGQRRIVFAALDEAKQYRWDWVTDIERAMPARRAAGAAQICVGAADFDRGEVAARRRGCGDV